MKKTRALIALALYALSITIAGCTKEADPGAKVNAPDYYNGPMKPRGGTGGSTGAGAEGS